MSVFVEREGHINAVVSENTFIRDSLGHAPGHGVEAHCFTVGLLHAELCVLLFQDLGWEQHAQSAGNEHRFAVSYTERFHTLNSADQLRSDSIQFDFGLCFKYWD